MIHRGIRRAACIAGGLAVLALLLAGRAIAGGPLPARGAAILGDYDAEPRRADGHVDAVALADRLRVLGANTYCWLVWHRATDWDDLAEFLPLADRAGIDVWVYLVPPSESPPHTARYSEPFRLDYAGWAEAIARRSLASPRLKGWIIDDFARNAATFTPAYVDTLQARARRINPRLALFALAYFPELREPFLADYGSRIDGVVAAYPADPDEIRWARALLGGPPQPRRLELRYPWRTHSDAGDFVGASRRVRLDPDSAAVLRFRERDDFAGATAGYHHKQVLVDGVTVWDSDVAGHAAGWNAVNLRIARPLPRRDSVDVTFRLLERRGVSNFGVRWWIDGIRWQGEPLSLAEGGADAWVTARRGAGSTSLDSARAGAEPSPALPLVVMVAATAAQDERRHGAPSTTARVLRHVDEALRAASAGWCDGVVTYCLDKTASSTVLDSVAVRYRSAARR